MLKANCGVPLYKPSVALFLHARVQANIALEDANCVLTETDDCAESKEKSLSSEGVLTVLPWRYVPTLTKDAKELLLSFNRSPPDAVLQSADVRCCPLRNLSLDVI